MNRKRYRESEITCWSDEWKRTDPDIVVYLPEGEDSCDAHNEHFLVVPTPRGDFVAVWTQSSSEGDGLHRVVISRSQDRGRTWSAPAEIDGPRDGDGVLANWAFPIVVPDTGRIYLLYNRYGGGPVDGYKEFCGDMVCKYSDDDGVVWQDGGTFALRRTANCSDDPNVPMNWIVWQTPILDSKGRVMAGFSRPTSSDKQPPKPEGVSRWDIESAFIRFDNILAEPDPAKLVLTTLPAGEHGLRVPYWPSPGLSSCNEPAFQNLPDGRIFCVLRTMTGYLWYAVSGDDGDTWTEPEPLRYRDDGPVIMHPSSPAPLYALNDGKYLLLYHNNDGLVYGDGMPVANGDDKIVFELGPGDCRHARNPAYLALGEFRPHAHQPLWFSKPKLFVDTDFVGFGVQKKTDAATYTSFFEYEGVRYFWYPDRKHFLLGKILTDEWLADLEAPA